MNILVLKMEDTNISEDYYSSLAEQTNGVKKGIFPDNREYYVIDTRFRIHSQNVKDAMLNEILVQAQMRNYNFVNINK